MSWIRASLELGGIVFLRFRPVPRVWASWLVLANAAALAFLPCPEAIVALVTVGIAVVAQTWIYRRQGFVRLLGTTHVLWIPQLLWYATRVSEADGVFAWWLIIVSATNAVSLVIDGVDLVRYVRGEREPSYTW